MKISITIIGNKDDMWSLSNMIVVAAIADHSVILLVWRDNGEEMLI